LFVLLYFFFWPCCCLFFFDIRILIALLVSSNSSWSILLSSISVLSKVITPLVSSNSSYRRTRRKPPTCRKSLTNFITLLYRLRLAWARFQLTTFVVIGTDCISSCKSNYHTITKTAKHVKLTHLPDMLGVK
jgi:hypothetical protein